MNTAPRENWNRTWAAIALVWALLLCFVPDPRPLATPAWSIQLVRSALHVQDAAARVIAAIALRMLFLGILGMLVMRAFGGRRLGRRGLLVLLVASIAGIATLWVNHRYFPIPAQLKLAVVATLAGALFAQLLRRNWWAGAGLVVVLGYTYFTLTGYSVDDDLDRATRAQVKGLFSRSASISEGDEGFLQLTSSAFELAAQRSRDGDPVLENQAAVLGLALVLGDEKLAKVAGRYVDAGTVPLCEKIRSRTTLYDRPDWSRHFWVSAGLVVLSGEARSLSVGIVKELKDANAGGSGFSFGDLTADGAGQRFAQVATRDVQAAVAMQERMQGSPQVRDLMPDIRDLPEGIHADEFEEQYGGAGGARSDSLVQVIVRRLDDCAALR